jgi:hypothetical protein
LDRNWSLMTNRFKDLRCRIKVAGALEFGIDRHIVARSYGVELALIQATKLQASWMSSENVILSKLWPAMSSMVKIGSRYLAGVSSTTIAEQRSKL